MSELERHTCGACGIEFGAPRIWFDARRADKGDIHCPNGHVLTYRKSKLDTLAEELSRERQRVAQRDDEIARERRMREAAERSASAARGQVTKIRNRISKGVCPDCNRSFTNLARHMACKHAGFAATETT